MDPGSPTMFCLILYFKIELFVYTTARDLFALPGSVFSVNALCHLLSHCSSGDTKLVAHNLSVLKW